MHVRYAIAAALLAGFTGLAVHQATLADEAPGTRGERETTAAVQGLSAKEIITALEGQGYTDFREIEREGPSYEVKARNRDGRFVEVYVSAETGQVVRSEDEREERD